MTDRHDIRTLSRIVTLKGKPIFDESATVITIDDEADGEFIKIEQSHDHPEIRIGKDEWPVLCGVIDGMIENCRDE